MNILFVLIAIVILILGAHSRPELKSEHFDDSGEGVFKTTDSFKM